MITDEFILRSLKLEKLCHHFHLSLQSGCTDTLKRMNRRYTIDEFETIVKRIRYNYNDAILTTDIIVGFPGESEDEFNQTYKFLSKIKFYKMHIFKYSIRQVTKAAEMKNQISPNIKEERSNKLIELSDKNEYEYLTENVGKELKVLFEEKVGELWKGHTANYLTVKVKSKLDLTNKIKKVKIENIDELELQGCII